MKIERELRTQRRVTALKQMICCTFEVSLLLFFLSGSSLHNRFLFTIRIYNENKHISTSHQFYKRKLGNGEKEKKGKTLF